MRMVETRFVSQSAGALSPINHLGLYQGYRELKLEPETLFHKDCSLGSVKNLSKNYSLLSYW